MTDLPLPTLSGSEEGNVIDDRFRTLIAWLAAAIARDDDGRLQLGANPVQVAGFGDEAPAWLGSAYTAANVYMRFYVGVGIRWNGTNWSSPRFTDNNGWILIAGHADGSLQVYSDVATGFVTRTYTAAQVQALKSTSLANSAFNLQAVDGVILKLKDTAAGTDLKNFWAATQAGITIFVAENDVGTATQFEFLRFNHATGVVTIAGVDLNAAIGFDGRVVGTTGAKDVASTKYTVSRSSAGLYVVVFASAFPAVPRVDIEQIGSRVYHNITTKDANGFTVEFLDYSNAAHDPPKWEFTARPFNA